MDGETTSNFYKPSSPLMRHELSSALIDALYILSDVKFNLNPTGHDLDVAWPTFSKVSNPGNGAFNWRAPSRAMSISSLDSSFSTSYENSAQGLSSSLGDVDETHEADLVAYKVEVTCRHRCDFSCNRLVFVVEIDYRCDMATWVVFQCRQTT